MDVKVNAPVFTFLNAIVQANVDALDSSVQTTVPSAPIVTFVPPLLVWSVS